MRNNFNRNHNEANRKHINIVYILQSIMLRTGQTPTNVNSFSVSLDCKKKQAGFVVSVTVTMQIHEVLIRSPFDGQLKKSVDCMKYPDTNEMSVFRRGVYVLKLSNHPQSISIIINYYSKIRVRKKILNKFRLIYAVHINRSTNTSSLE